MPKIIMLDALVLILCLADVSCSSPNENDLPLMAPTVGTPVAAGLIITKDDPTPLAVWRTPLDKSIPFKLSLGAMAPTDNHELPRYYSFDSPYPNPFTDTMTISVGLPVNTVVSVWVVKERWIDDAVSDAGSSFGATIDASNRLAVREFVHGESLPAGYHTITWDGTDNLGKPLPSGFYRVYAKVGNIVAWHDTRLYYSLDELPSDLRALVEKRDQVASN